MLPVSCQGCKEACMGNCHCYEARVKALDDTMLRGDLLNQYCQPVEVIG